MLSERNLYIIKGMIADNKTLDEIKGLLKGVSIKDIEEVYNNNKPSDTSYSEEDHENEVIQAAIKQIEDTGIQSPRIGYAINKTIKELSPSERANQEIVYNTILKHLGASNMLVKSGGAVAMTPGLSKYAEENVGTQRGKLGDHLFHPNKDK